ncbi:MAG TPA: FecR domain-containing protein [bacterium]|nr:FecR domain-containing protein [bacterium]
MREILKFLLILFLSGILVGGTVNIVSPYNATIIRIDGTVLKKDISKNIWIPASKGDILDDGDTLKTGEDAYAELKFSDGSIVKINASTEVSVYRDYLSLAIGYIKLYITKLFPNFEIRTPSGIAGVRGTEFSVEVLQDQTTLVTVYEGEVDVTAQGKTIRIRKGESAIVKPKSPPTLHKGDLKGQSKGQNNQGQEFQHGQNKKDSNGEGPNRPSNR